MSNWRVVGGSQAPCRVRKEGHDSVAEQTPAVLVIEDDPMLRRVLRRVLEDAGWLCRDAHDLASAVERLGSERFDVVLTDIHVGRRTAHVLTEKLASMETGIPVVAMSGAASRSDLIRLLRAGVDDFLEKPFDPDDLVEVLERSARRGRATSAPSNVGVASNEEDGDGSREEDGDGSSGEEILVRRVETVEEAVQVLRTWEWELPALGDASERIVELMKDEQREVGPVLELVRSEPAFVTRVLHAANATQVAGGRRIERPREACIRLGNRRVLTLAQETVLMPLVSGLQGGLEAEAADLWSQILASSRGARHLAVAVDYLDPDQAAFAALMHDVGEIAVLRAWGQVAPLGSNGKLREVSHDLHEKAGGAVLKGWGCPAWLVELASSHHGASLKPRSFGERQLRDLVESAWLGARRAGFTYLDREVESEEHALEAALDRLGLGQRMLDEVFSNVRRELASPQGESAS